MLDPARERDMAVSPVIGVMLLLAIVIIIAALVASFASGAAETKEKAPSADLAVYSAGNGNDFTLVFEHRGGDLIKIEDLRINTWVHLPDGSLHAESYEGEELEELLDCENWRAGSGLYTGNLKSTREFLFGIKSSSDKDLSDCIRESAVLDVAVYHLPGGVLLHKSSILLKER